MKTLVYIYENPDKQTVHFRGYVKQYSGPNAIITICPVVRNNRAQAERDAKKLVKTLLKTSTKISDICTPAMKSEN